MTAPTGDYGQTNDRAESDHDDLIEHDTHGPWKQDGVCVYCSCGAYLYQGVVPKDQAKFAAALQDVVNQTLERLKRNAYCTGSAKHPAGGSPPPMPNHGVCSVCDRVVPLDPKQSWKIDYHYPPRELEEATDGQK